MSCDHIISTEADIDISELEVSESNGFLLQGLQFLNSSVELFSIYNTLRVGPDSVCAIVFLGTNGYPVAATSPLRYFMPIIKNV